VNRARLNRIFVSRASAAAIFLITFFVPAMARPEFHAGAVIPKVTCIADPGESYALYLPSGYSPSRKWPIIYLFDPGARGRVAVEVVREAAEKYGYIVAASNNSRNGAQGGSTEAANAMWRDTQGRFPIDERRRYVAGMSGGARVATSIAIACKSCVAGVIANAAGFPTGTAPTRAMKFAYFAAVGNADFNYAEFVELRRTLDAVGARYHIRVFEGQHGWAPAEVWLEALEWMDLQAMIAGSLAHDESRIAASLRDTLARAQAFEEKKDVLAAYREYDSAVRDFGGLADLSVPKARLRELQKSKQLKSAEKREASEIEEQDRIEAGPSAQMEKIPSGDLSTLELSELRGSFADLKRQVASSSPTLLVPRRALSGLVVQAYESGQSCVERKDYRAALLYFDLAAAGSANSGWAHFQRARVYALSSKEKDMLAELRLSSKEGFHDAEALDAAEFQPYSKDPEFQALAAGWKTAVK